MGLFDKLFKKAFESVTPEQAKEISDQGAYFIDVREPHEYKTGHAPSAVNIPLGSLDRRLGSIPKEREILVICQSGARSTSASAFLAKAGYTVFNVKGGTMNWRRSGQRISK
jgi:rhodanese-related sulfurtransferase